MLVQTLRNYRCKQTGATLVQVHADVPGVHAGERNFQAIFYVEHKDKANEIIEILECPMANGIWFVREFISGRDDKSFGRWYY